MTLANSKENARLTIYLGGAKRQSLIEWAKELTHAKSDSEAIFSALEMLKQKIAPKNKQDLRKLLSATKGAWADNLKIDKALQSVEKGWQHWTEELF